MSAVITSYTIYVTPKDIFENHHKYFHRNHYLAERFRHEHKVQVTNLKQMKFYQTKSNITGELAMEVTVDVKYTEPLKGKLWNANEAGNPL